MSIIYHFRCFALFHVIFLITPIDHFIILTSYMSVSASIHRFATRASNCIRYFFKMKIPFNMSFLQNIAFRRKKVFKSKYLSSFLCYER
jgi:hypothetical protein